MAVRANANADAGGDRAYRAAFVDWLACACAGADERAARAVRASGGDLLADVAFAATAGHVLDFDDTFADGVAHVSAASAPAALVLAAHLGRSLGATLDAYAEGYEAMAALAAASHPALYDAGWHPTAVCAPVGAAVAASRLPPACRPRCWLVQAPAWIKARLPARWDLRECWVEAGRAAARQGRRMVPRARSSATGSSCVRAVLARTRRSRPPSRRASAAIG